MNQRQDSTSPRTDDFNQHALLQHHIIKITTNHEFLSYLRLDSDCKQASDY